MQHLIAQNILPILEKMLPFGTKLTQEELEKMIQLPKVKMEGTDYTLSCGPLSKILQQKPHEVAEKLCQQLQAEGLPHPICLVKADKVFVNFGLEKSFMLREIIEAILRQKEHYGQQSSNTGKVVCIEYSSPNIAKHFAVYHLLSTLIGHVLGNLYESRGWKVFRLNHIGDWGTNIGYLIAAVKCEIGLESFNHLYETLSPDDFLQKMQEEYVAINQKMKAYDQDCFQKALATLASESVHQLAQNLSSEELLKHLKHKDPQSYEALSLIYNKSMKENPYRNQARTAFVELEQGEPSARATFDKIKIRSMQVFEKLYQKLGVHFDSQDGESFYMDKMQHYLQEFEKRGVVEASEGARVIKLDDLPKPYKLNVPCMVVKSDGGTTYHLRDLSGLLYRKEHYQFDRLLYVVANQQILHFQQAFGALRKAGFDWIDNVEHLPFGMMSIDGRIGSTRGGNVVSATDLFEEVEKEIRKIMEKNNQENKQWNEDNHSDSKPVLSPEEIEKNAPKVALGAIIYQNISTNRMKDKDFNLERALNFLGDSGPYLQMVVPKMNRILMKYEQREKKPLSQNPDYGLLIHPSEIQLVSLLGEFSQAIDKALQVHEPAILTNYLISVATAAHKFHHDCRVLQAETEALKEVRLVLTQAVSIVMTNGLKLLGFPIPEKM